MGRGQYDHPEYRPLAERCLLSFGPTTPLVPNYFYNNNLQIVQTPDHVMILMEMVHDARVVRIGGKHLPKHIRPWMGDSIGHWEGDTLVVDTTNFPPQQNFRGVGNLHVSSASGASMPTHQLPVYGRTRDLWTPFTRDSIPGHQELIYEYACHEGINALGTLSARQRRERLGSTIDDTKKFS